MFLLKSKKEFVKKNMYIFNTDIVHKDKSPYVNGVLL